MSEININGFQNRLTVTLAEALSKPLLSVFIVFIEIARLTRWQNVVGRIAALLGHRNEVVLVQRLIPVKHRWPVTAVSASAMPVVEAALPVANRECCRGASDSRPANEMSSTIDIWLFVHRTLASFAAKLWMGAPVLGCARLYFVGTIGSISEVISVNLDFVRLTITGLRFRNSPSVYGAIFSAVPAAADATVRASPLVSSTKVLCIVNKPFVALSALLEDTRFVQHSDIPFARFRIGVGRQRNYRLFGLQSLADTSQFITTSIICQPTEVLNG